MGQMMSVRPDVLPQPALVELAKMQDGVEGFEQSTAIAMVEQELGNDPNPYPYPDPDPNPNPNPNPDPDPNQELGRPLMEVFSEFAAEPVAAASLAQVRRAWPWP